MAGAERITRVTGLILRKNWWWFTSPKSLTLARWMTSTNFAAGFIRRLLNSELREYGLTTWKIFISVVSMKLAQAMSRLGAVSAFKILAKAKALEAQGRSLVFLGICSPVFRTPANIVEAGKKAIDD